MANSDEGKSLLRAALYHQLGNGDLITVEDVEIYQNNLPEIDAKGQHAPGNGRIVGLVIIRRPMSGLHWSNDEYYQVAVDLAYTKNGNLYVFNPEVKRVHIPNDSDFWTVEAVMKRSKFEQHWSDKIPLEVAEAVMNG